MTQKQIDALQVGDVVLRHNRNGSVSTRVVRYVSRYRHRLGVRVSYKFTKLRRSQYRTATTIIYPFELLDRRYVATGHRMRLRSRLDRLIAKAVHARDMGHSFLTQNDVVGVVS